MPKGRRAISITPEIRRAVERMRADGLRWELVAERIGVATSTVVRWYKRGEFSPAAARRLLPYHRWNQAQDLVVRNLSIMEAARMLLKSESQVAERKRFLLTGRHRRNALRKERNQ
jgi:transposase-like protein